jgi:hypothetical protein
VIQARNIIQKFIICIAAIALLFNASSSRALAQELKLFPVDEAAKDPSFKRFRDRLILAVKKHDRRFLVSILHPKILNSFGGDGGIKEFVSMSKLNSPSSKVWSELLEVLSLGGSFNRQGGQKYFEAPYVSSRWDTIQYRLPPDGDAFSHSAIISTNVPAYSMPNVVSPVAIYLSYDVVAVDYERSIYNNTNTEFEELLWVKIKTLKGKEGYVQAGNIRSAVGQRAYFKKIRGKWLMDAFVGGD